MASINYAGRTNLKHQSSSITVGGYDVIGLLGIVMKANLDSCHDLKVEVIKASPV
ncbi:hypothetical protein D3C85_1859510 [compost metagenome]